MRCNLQKAIFFLILLCSATVAWAGVLKGTITDKQTKEPLTGAAIQVAGGTQGAVADIDGNYKLELKNGTYNLTVRYVGYKTVNLNNIKVKGETVINVALETDAQALGEVSVTARKNLEGENALLLERQKATLAIENLGSKEMSVKGIGNVEEGVKKITGVSIADAGQLIVRGLGDRYSTTTLNGLPIASPNPDNKLIPLDLFPSSTVQNITVSKVYDAAAFADYSGAHIDISTKENTTNDFFTVGLSLGGAFNTLGKDRYQMDRSGTLLTKSKVDSKALSMPLADYREYVKTKNIFDTSFNVDKKSAMPDFSGNIAFGKSFKVADRPLDLLVSLSASNKYQNMEDAFYKTLEANGNVLKDFNYNDYTQELRLASLAHLGYTLRKHDRIGYTFFYARNASDSYKLRNGEDSEGHVLTGSNSVTHIYALQNHQLNGQHFFGDNDRFELGWGGSYNNTSSDEPDRRQVMYNNEGNGKYSFFKLNSQETMRYFGNLSEKEWNGRMNLKWKWADANFLKGGVDYKNKRRDYSSTRFYYDVNKINSEITDIYTPEEYLNQQNIADGIVEVERNQQPRDSYRAGNDILAAYLQTDFYPIEALLVNVGLRYEGSQQWVEYASDGGTELRRDLDKHDLFPALNMKYSINQANVLRFSVSRTVTRPSFIEMAPFLYQESYGAAQIRGNEDLQNGYNYNFDLRYELFGKNGDMISVTGYYKRLDKPIERIQTIQGGATLHSFQNANNGVAAGAEMELRKQIVKDLRLGANVSYMYTDVKLPEGGAYTNDNRPLQGASPILANADITYSPRFGEEKQLTLALLYNLQGSRIHAVGIAGLGDVKQDALHSLNFNAGFTINKHFGLKFQMTDLLNRDVVFRQDVPKDGGRKVEVERYKKGIGFEVGFSYNL